MSSSTNIAQVDRDGDQDPTVDRLHEALRRKILCGDLAPGEVISQVKLAQNFEVGRTPLREALRMLQREGLVQAEFNRRIRVSTLYTAELEQIYAHRIVLEAVAVRASTPRFGPGDLNRLHELLAEMESYLPDPTPHLAEWERPHRAFHALLISQAGSRIVEDLRRLQDHAERYRAILSHQLPESFPLGAQAHRRIVEAVEAADREVAARLLARHLAASGAALISHTDPAHDAVTLREALLLVQGRQE